MALLPGEKTVSPSSAVDYLRPGKFATQPVRKLRFTSSRSMNMSACDGAGPAVETMLIEGYRAMSPAQKLKRVRALTRSVQEPEFADVLRRHPDTDGRELALCLASRWLDPELMVRAFGWDVRKIGY